MLLQVETALDGDSIEAKEIIRLFKYCQDVVSASMEDKEMNFIAVG